MLTGKQTVPSHQFPFETGELAVGILAAGESRRFGSCKQMAIYEGETLLSRTIRAASELTTNVHVITGANAEEIRASHNHPVRWIHNPNYRLGQGSSLRAFARHLLENPIPRAKAVMVLLCDQPKVSAEHLKELYSVFSRDPVNPAVAEFNGDFGPPSLFPAGWLEKFAILNGDQGAKRLLLQTKFNTLTLPEASIDIDTREDFHSVTIRNM